MVESMLRADGEALVVRITGCAAQIRRARYRRADVAVKEVACADSEAYAVALREMLALQELPFDKVSRCAIWRARRLPETLRAACCDAAWRRGAPERLAH